MKTKIGLISASSLVISSMIGTGVYTSLGFQVIGLKSFAALLALWLVGGVVALCGALVYGEIGTVMGGSGGEYNYLSVLYHPLLGFMSGFVSATVGFAAPVALSAIAFGKYIATIFPDSSSEWSATFLILAVNGLHFTGIRSAALFQRYFTLINLCLILAFIMCGLLHETPQSFRHTSFSSGAEEIFSSSFAVSLVYVSYSYSGWNSTAYIAGELKDPGRNLPLSLFGGTALVTLLYLALNLVFLLHVPIDELAGKVEVGFLAAGFIFGEKGAYIVSGLIAFGLLASVNAMSFIGPRITHTIAADHPVLRALSKENKNGNPYIAQTLLTVLALIMVHTSTFDHVLTFISFTLSFFTGLTVGGIFILRKKQPGHKAFRAWGYPFTPLIFLLVNSWMMVYVFIQSPVPSSAGLLVAGIGALIFFTTSAKNKQRS